MAYGAAICARTFSDTGTLTSLLATKSRLAPRKTLCFQDLSFVQWFWAVNYWKMSRFKLPKFKIPASNCQSSTDATSRLVETHSDTSKPSRYYNATSSSSWTTNFAALVVRALLVADNWNLYSTTTNSSRSKLREVRFQTVIRRSHLVHSGSWRWGNHASSKSNKDLMSDQKGRKFLRFATMGIFW